MISSIRELHFTPLDEESRALAVAGSVPIVTWGLEQLHTGVREVPVLGEYFLQLFTGHGLYEGAELIIDLKDPQADPSIEEDRPWSIAFFSDIILCIEGSLQDPLESTPVHEVTMDELNLVSSIIFSRR